MAPLLAILGPMVSSFVQGRQKVSAAKAEAKVARMTSGIPGYSDEYLIFIWSAPFIMCFIPGLAPYAEAGFAQLKNLPDWYIGMFGTLSLSVFGIDKLMAWRGK